jgi:1-acyl-sn-glycerol-3-phosphate acyltransferase
MNLRVVLLVLIRVLLFVWGFFWLEEAAIGRPPSSNTRLWLCNHKSYVDLFLLAYKVPQVC